MVQLYRIARVFSYKGKTYKVGELASFSAQDATRFLEARLIGIDRHIAPGAGKQIETTAREGGPERRGRRKAPSPKEGKG